MTISTAPMKRNRGADLHGQRPWPVSTKRALGRTRTCNLLIRSQVLYPLSYERESALVSHMAR